LPKEYEVQVSKLEERFGSLTNLLTIQDMLSKLNLKYARLKRQSDEQVQTDQALAAFHRYKGKCANCGTFGHKSTECWSKSMTTTKEEDGEAKKSKKGRNPTDKKHITCFGCGKKGHYKSECPEREEDEEETDVANLTLDGRGVVLMTVSPTVKLPSKTWIADSGASTHITNEERGLYEKRCVNEPISLGNSEVVHATIVGKLDVTVAQAGRRASFTLENVRYIPKFYAKIFSLTVAMEKGCAISSTHKAIIVKRSSFRLEFNRTIKCKNGFVCAINLDVRMTSTTIKCPDDYEKVPDITTKNDIMTTDTNENFDKTMKTTPTDITGTNDMNNRIKNENSNETKRNDRRRGKGKARQQRPTDAR